MKFILRYNIFLIFILTGIRLLAQNVPEYSGDLKFIENKNQWDKKILFKTEIAGGDLYLEKDGFTYNFLNQEDLVKFKGHNHSHGHEEDISLKNKSLNRRIPIVIRGHAVKLKFLNSNQSSNVSAEKPLDEYNNYYIGKDESKWASKVKIFQNVIYNNLWNNINMKVYSRGPNPKYDFILNPGAKLENIAMKYEGANNVYIRRGNLIIETSVNNITELKPYAYQIIKGQIKVVDCKFILNNTDSVITFSFPEGYDKSKMLVVDPELILATFSGSKSDNWGFSATYDNEGHTYMAGLCFGTQYPVTTGAYQMQFNGGDSLYLWWYNIYYPGVDIAIMKFDSTHAGSQTPVKKIYATYLGGSGEEMPHSLIVNSNNELLVYGTTGSLDFPTTQNAYNRTFKGGTEIILDNVLWFRQGSDIFISKFNADGSKLLASTLIGGTNNDGFNSDKVQNPDWMGDPVDESIYGVLKTNYADEVRGGIMVDENNNVYVVSSTHSKDFPVTANAFQKTFAGGRQDGCVFKMDNNLSALIWSSYLGGTGNDGAYGITINSKDQVIVCGGTTSQDFPTTSKAIYPKFQGGTADGFVSVISERGDALLYSTYYGSNKYDQAYLVDKDKNNNIYLFGQTRAKGQDLIYNATYFKIRSGQFVCKINPTLDTLLWSTRFGSIAKTDDSVQINISPTAMLVDYCNNIYLCGWGGDTNPMGNTFNMDTTAGAYRTKTDGSDFYIIVISDDASKLKYATFFGAWHPGDNGTGDHVDGGTSRFNNKGKIYQAVCASCAGHSDFDMTTPNAYSRVNGNTKANGGQNNNCNEAVFVFDMNLPSCVASFTDSSACAGDTAKFFSTSLVPLNSKIYYHWDFGDIDTIINNNDTIIHQSTLDTIINSGKIANRKDKFTHIYKKGGTYKVKLTIIDSLSCNVVSYASINEYTVISTGNKGGNTLKSDTLCRGSRKQIGQEPDLKLTYKWRPKTGLSDTTVSNPYCSATNNIRYTIFISNGKCHDTLFQNIYVATLKLRKNNDTTVCSGSNLKLTASTGDNTTVYSWSTFPDFRNILNTSTKDSTLDIAPTTTTTYYIKTSNAYCDTINKVVVTVQPISISAGAYQTICSGKSVQINVKNQIPAVPLTYQWSPAGSIISGATTATPTVNPTVTTTYTVTAKNAIGCSAKDSVVVSVTNLTTATTKADALCGSCNGQATITVTGGILPYTYIWDDPSKQTTSTAIKLCGGNYNVTITDAKGCKAVNSVSIQSSSTVILKINKTDLKCGVRNTGTAVVKTSGGTSPFTFKWSNGKTTDSIYGLDMGTYTVTVTDAQNCSKIDSITILLPQILTVSLKSTDLLCYNIPTGKINTTVTGGTAPFTYTWNNAEKTQNLTNLNQGRYFVTVTDINGCTSTGSVLVLTPDSLNANSVLQNVSCGRNNGSISLNVTGGTSPYTYLWSDGSKASSLNNLNAGTYSVTITDNNGCTIIKPFNITGSPALNADIYKKDIQCNGLNNGFARVDVISGSPPYTYSWSNNKTTDSINNVVPGTYSVTVTDTNKCIITLGAIINEPTQLKITLTPVNLLCYGIKTGAVNTTVTGGTTPYIYSWQSGQKTQNLTNIDQGRYFVTVTDENGCITSGNASVLTPDTLNTDISVSETTCGNNNGSASANISGGTTPYTYNWSSGENTQTIKNLASGSYILTVSDKNNCTYIKSITVSSSSDITISINHTDIKCTGANNGTAGIKVKGGIQPYNYLWSNGGKDSIITGLSKGTFSITVKDSSSCTKTDIVKITEPALLTLAVNTKDIVCGGDSTGSITTNVSGGTLPYTYSWSDGETVKDLTNRKAGTYIITVYDSNGCQTANTTIIKENAPLNAVINKTDIKCGEINSGSISLTVSGGVPPYSYLWSNGNISNTLSNLSGGIYSVTITDINKCQLISSVEITDFNDILKLSSVKIDIDCDKNKTGVVQEKISGGSMPYKYLWSNGDTLQTITNLQAGIYKVTVSDAYNCTKTDQVEIKNPPPVVLNIIKTNISCNGKADGKIVINVTSGKPPYTFLWADGRNTSTIQDLFSGEYNINVTDSNKCQTNADIDISEPAALALTVNKTDVSCYGDTNGTAIAKVNGGTLPYSYYWSNGETTSEVTNLGKGSINVTVTDANGCKISGSQILNQPEKIIITVSSKDIFCPGANDGAVSANATGGVPDYIYSWDTNPIQTGSTINNLSKGKYTVTVTDKNNCSQTNSVVIKALETLTDSIKTTNVSCLGSSNGIVTITVNGGKSPYSIVWYNGSNSTTITGLKKGNYSVTITDGNNCKLTDTAKIYEPEQLKAVINKTDVTCRGDINGTLKAIITGGTSPYLYLWSNSMKSDSIAGLGTGNYFLTVTDKNGCTTLNNTIITESETPLTIKMSKTDVTCQGGHTGNALVSVSGGTLPYSYSWNTNPVRTDSIISSLTAGNYSVTIKDIKGCFTTGDITLKELTRIDLSFDKSDLKCNGDKSGTITANPTGGKNPYKYSWSNAGITQSINNLDAGIYSVNITDSNGCTLSGSASITEPDAITLNILKKDNLCFGNITAWASVQAKGGTAPYKYKWSYRDTTSSAINNLAAGNYYITVNDNNNCTKNDSIIIKQPSAGLSLSFRHSNITCYGLSTGSINTNVAGGTSPYIYNWSTGSSEQNIKDLKKGIYKLTVTDFNKCTISGLDSIVEPDSLKLAYNKIDNICNNDKRGTINVNVSGGTSPYYYTWNTNPVTNASSITMLAAGKYTISVSDANKCKTSQTINISEPKPFNIIHSEKNISCNGLCNGSISVIVTGNTSPYSYSWNTKKSQNSPDIENVCAGKYRVTISDTNNCTTLDSITISAPPILNSFLRDTIDVYCNGLCTGQAGIGVSGGDQPYTYSWNTGLNTATITNLCPGTYSVTVKDNNGCQSVSGYNVKIKSSLSLNVDSIVNPTCEGAKNGTVKITVTNGKEPYIYSWSSGQKTSVITGLSAGKYNVTITDGYGCNKQTMINLSEPSKLLLKTDSLKKPSCSISCNGFTEVSASGGTPPYQYSWNTGLNTYQISQLCEGKYSVTVIDANNCVANVETDIISPKEIKSILTPTGTLCANICNGRINMNVAGGTPPYTYKWNNNQINKNNYGLCAGKYIVTITDANGCSRIDSGTIKSLNSSPDFRIVSDNNNVQPGQQVNLTVISGVNNLNYQWVYADDLNSTNPTHAIANPIKSKMYYLKATDKNNCARLDSIFINVIEKNECNESNVFIPNAFTPNEDNVNEKIFVRGRNIKEIYFAIFDRWGEKMFETRNQNEGWDGKYKGMDCKPAVFVYYLEVTCPGDEKFFKKGNITLIR